MNYHNITTNDMLNGDGLRVVLWVSGCAWHCKGCHNPETWKTGSGIPFTDDTFNELITKLNEPHISGLTFSGGDPLHPHNRVICAKIAEKVKALFPNKTIWLYTGYTYEGVKDLEIMKYVDVVVDGVYIEKLRDVNLPYRGSTNQRIIYASSKERQN